MSDDKPHKSPDVNDSPTRTTDLGQTTQVLIKSW